jgi:hypothetical protein
MEEIDKNQRKATMKVCDVDQKVTGEANFSHDMHHCPHPAIFSAEPLRASKNNSHLPLIGYSLLLRHHLVMRHLKVPLASRRCGVRMQG